MKRNVAVIGLAVALLAFLLFFVLLDYGFAVTLAPRALALFAAVGVLLGALNLLAGDRRSVALLVGCYLAALLLLRLVALSPVKPFRAFFNGVQQGMTRAAVLAELDRHFPERGRFPKPVRGNEDAARLWLVLDPTNGEYNSEVVLVTFRDGLTSGKEYSGD